MKSDKNESVKMLRKKSLMEAFRQATARFREISRQIRAYIETAKTQEEQTEAKNTAAQITSDSWRIFTQPSAGGRTAFGFYADHQISAEELEAELQREPEVKQRVTLDDLSAQLREVGEQLRALSVAIGQLEDRDPKRDVAGAWNQVQGLAKQCHGPKFAGVMENWSYSRPPYGSMCGKLNGQCDVISERIVGLGFDPKSGLPYVTDETGHSFLLASSYGGAWNPVEEMDWIQSGIIISQAAIARREPKPGINSCPYVPPEGGIPNARPDHGKAALSEEEIAAIEDDSPDASQTP